MVTSRMRATIIHHPSGGSASDDALATACSLLSRHFELDVSPLEPNSSPTELAHKAVARGSELLIASGGDGTVSAVAAAVVGKPDLRLGILPQGTANSISVHLGIPGDLARACEVIIAGHERVIDTARVNDRPMVLMCTLGIHAEAVTQVDPELKRKYGALAYVLEEASRFFDDSLFEASIETRSERFTFRASALTIANIARPATLLAQGPAEIIEDDGKLDVTLVAIDGVADAIVTSLHLAAHALAGLPANRANIAHFQVAWVRVTTPEPVRVMVDGEDACETPITVQAVPRSLRVRVPAE